MGLNRILVFPQRLKRAREDILFLADPTLLRAGRYHRTTVAKVHDLRPLTPHSDRRLTREMFKFVVPRLKSLARIIVTTNVTKRMLEETGVDSARIRVVPDTSVLGSHPDHAAASLRHIAAGGKLRILCVSSDRPFKNLGLLFQIAATLHETEGDLSPEFTLVSRLRSETQAELQKLNLQNLKVVSAVPDIDLLYDSADVLLQPSLAEGFGRPMIEAMSFGIPTVASRSATVEEVTGNSGVLVSAGDLDSWRAAILSFTRPAIYSSASHDALTRFDAYTPERFRTSVGAAFDGL